MNELIDFLEVRAKLGALESNLDSHNLTERFRSIREIYEIVTPQIIGAGKHFVDPYFVDWIKYLTPIEFDAWQCIRGRGVALYPQYPVGQFFVDFGNPYFKIGLECDGKDFHSVKKDTNRDELLADLGWKIFRISGSQCYSDLHEGMVDEVEDEAEKEETKWNWLHTSVDGLVYSIGLAYFGRGRKSDIDLAMSALDAHRLADFEL